MRIDTIFTNGRIRTMDAARPIASRMGVLHGRIVGLDEELDGVTADRTVDLGGQPVLPGFHDAHHHLSLTGARLAAIDLRPGRISSLDELYSAIAQYARANPDEEWIRGAGYDQNFLEDHPTAEGLDRASGGRPVIVEHVSGHMLVASAKAFAIAGYDDLRDVPVVPGGGIPRDADGRALGLLQEQAMQLIYALVRPMPLDEVQHNLDLASRHALAYGLTSVTEPGIGATDMIGNSPVDFHSYQTANEHGVLGVRVTLMPFVSTLHDIDRMPEWFGLDLGIRTGLGDDLLRVGPVKVLSDGSFIGRSAAMHRCYLGEADNTGVLLHEPERLEDFIVRAHASGWTVATHAIGDRAADHVLDAIEAAQRRLPRPGVRHRIEHFALATDERIRRTAALGVIPVPQGVFISDFGDGMAAAVDPELRDQIYRVKSLADAGIVLNGSSDSPVSDANPLTSIRDMILRLTGSGEVLGPQERISVEDAVRAYTYGSAYAVGQENDKGTLSAGKLADFITLTDDLFEIEPERITDQRVTATVVGGEVRFGEL
ncbi:MAG TPA: amidohydrolase [Candidatus Agrococcus pullicola]|uniref:Amidohydrolase n=1 Tax=Candidatus Agrococcus pullicola TaxID=2838429 RepID=A0A9D1YVC4_9MICO|nr:amidohydrolase [Candidatus Agrococcus pullicola]